jgi:hypothetical protein
MAPTTNFEIAAMIRRPSLINFAFCLGALGALGTLAACESSLPITCPDVAVIKDASQFTQFRPGPGRDAVDVVFKAEMTAAHLECSFGEDAIDTNVTFALTVSRGPAYSGAPAVLPYFVAVVSADERKLVTKRPFELSVPFGGQQTLRLVQEVPTDATVVPKPAGLLGRSSIGSGPVSNMNGTQQFNLTGAQLNAAQRGGGGGGGSKDGPPARRPGTILPGTQGAVPYQVLIGFQLDKDQLGYNREQIPR